MPDFDAIIIGTGQGRTVFGIPPGRRRDEGGCR
jgi:hypothetical protein